MSEYSIFPVQTLENFSAAILESGGFTNEEATITAKSLILSNLMGHDSHGIMRVSEYLAFLSKNEVFSNADIEVLNETDNSLWVNGHFGLGQVQMNRFLDLLLLKAKGQAVTCGAMIDCAHIGRLGEWSEYLGKKGYAAMVCVNDNGVLQFVAPPNGKEGRTSTNPVAFAIPLPDNEVFSLDISTSAVAVGKIKLAYQAGETVATGLLQTIDGIDTNEPAVMFEDPKGTLKPMGGAQDYKGFGLSMFLDCLVAGLSGGFTPPAPQNAVLSNNTVITIWNPSLFNGLAHMQTEAKKYMDFIRQTEPINQKNPVRVAGDRSKKEISDRLHNGIPISKGALQKLVNIAQKQGVPIPKDIEKSL